MFYDQRFRKLRHTCVLSCMPVIPAFRVITIMEMIEWGESSVEASRNYTVAYPNVCHAKGVRTTKSVRRWKHTILFEPTSSSSLFMISIMTKTNY